MKRIGVLILVLALGAAALARTSADPDAIGVPAVPGAEFFALDVIIASGHAGLGAYQVEITPRQGAHVQLVGIEGGDAGAFADAPAYDAAALHRTEGFDRVILAAFTTDRLVPVGEVRVARVHFHADSDGDPGFTVRLVAAGGTNAMSIPASARLAPVRMDTDIHDNDGVDREGASR